MAGAILIFVIVIDGLIHLMGFTKAFHYASVNAITRSISQQQGLFWLLAAILFLVTAGCYLFKKQYWWLSGLAAIVISQLLIVQNWADAKWGTLANVIILLPVFFSFLRALPSSYGNRYKREVKKELAGYSVIPMLTHEDIAMLPLPVQKYLLYTNVVCKPMVDNFRAVFIGRMTVKQGGKWMNITSQQYDFFDDPARFFYIQSDMSGIPYDGLHVYMDGNATMQIKIASLFKVADARGKKMSQGETVTLFNDMCVLAPASLICPDIQWETIDLLTVKARFTNKGITITAQLYFNEQGALVNFVSNDRFQSSDGKTYKNYQWSTPVGNYKEFSGVRIASYGEAIWHTPEGDFTYAKFELKELEYNCTEFKRYA